MDISLLHRENTGLVIIDMQEKLMAEIQENLRSYDPIEKMEFNALGVEAFNKRLEEVRLHNIVLMGVETHVCVFQTCVSLLERGYRVHIPHQAVGSRTSDNRRIGLSLMRDSGALITSTETIIFQLLQKAGTKQFKAMLKYVK
ncbi:MAG: isochorismatase family protein [Anaerolineae bacterium]